MHNLESSLEKIARILARQFHVNVVFEGNQAKTDGKTIFLPFFNDMTPELQADLNGYLDHEVGHCVFTSFPDFSKVRTHFHKELLNVVEDIRIERAMMKKFPGTKYHITPLREKVTAKSKLIYNTFPWTVRFVVAVQWTMEGREVPVDNEIARHMAACKPEIEKLNSCTTTLQLYNLTKTICEKLSQDREEEKKEAKEASDTAKNNAQNGSKSSKGEAKPSDKSNSPGNDSSDSQSAKGEKSEKNKAESSKQNAKNGSEEKSQKDKKENEQSEGQGSMPSSDPKVSAKKESADSMLNESMGNPSSSFDSHEIDVHRMINKQLGEVIKKEESNGYRYGPRSSKMALAVTTRYDVVTDFSKKGDDKKYEENIRWKSEREQGTLNTRDLAKMTISPNYRHIFKETLKNETDKVAVSIVVDLSGSMAGPKLTIAQETAVAMSEALKGLGMAFEVSGFHTLYSREMELMGASRGSRFTRLTQKIHHQVFKAFDNSKLDGLACMRSDGCNDDGESIFWAAKRLADRQETRKILIVLSDGMPKSDADDQVLQNDLRYRLAAIEKSGIETVGIGITTDAVKHFYKDFLIVNDVKDLTRVCMGKLMKILTRK
jgi:cobalamin biosynthesis protein CobT